MVVNVTPAGEFALRSPSPDLGWATSSGLDAEQRLTLSEESSMPTHLAPLRPDIGGVEAGMWADPESSCPMICGPSGLATSQGSYLAGQQDL